MSTPAQMTWEGRCTAGRAGYRRPAIVELCHTGAFHAYRLQMAVVETLIDTLGHEGGHDQNDCVVAVDVSHMVLLGRYLNKPFHACCVSSPPQSEELGQRAPIHENNCQGHRMLDDETNYTMVHHRLVPCASSKDERHLEQEQRA